MWYNQQPPRVGEATIRSSNNAKVPSGKLSSGKRQQAPSHSQPQPQSRPETRNTKVHMSELGGPRRRRGGSSGRGNAPTASTLKRKTVGSAQEPAKRIRSTPSTEMKDVAYVRRTMHIPSREECPGLSQKILMEPKEKLYNAIHHTRLGRLNSHFSTLREGMFRCSLSCTLQSLHEPINIVGEGTNKVRLTYSRFSSLLTISRDWLRTQHTYN